ncbi:MAG: MFS transporter [Rhodocyclaceae bacterium]
MIPILIPIGALLAGIALLLLGTGLLNTLLALRGGLEGFGDTVLGLIGSSYFAGFFIGTLIAPRLIRHMGHVRAFAFFAAAITACALLHALIVDAVFWIVLRVLTGVALVGFYTVIESWLNSESPAARRGQVFAVYMAINLLALAGAQQFLHLASPADFTLFAVAAIFVCIALMPVVATRLPPPALVDTPRLSLGRVWSAAPAAVVGAVCSGLAMGAFWGLGAVYAGRMGLAPGAVATFITVTILAGAVLQWPIGRLSDRLDRRLALAVVCALAAAGGLLMAILGGLGLPLTVGAVLFGGAAFAVYPVVVAHLIDHLRHEEILPGNAALLMLHGVAAAFGPALAGMAMSGLGALAFPLYLAAMLTPAALFALYQSRHGRDEIVEEAAHFVPMLRTSPTALEMMAADAAGDGPAPDADAAATPTTATQPLQAGSRAA